MPYGCGAAATHVADAEREETKREEDNQAEHQEADRASSYHLGRGKGRSLGPPGEGRVARPQLRVSRPESALHLIEDRLLATGEDHVTSRGCGCAFAAAL